MRTCSMRTLASAAVLAIGLLAGACQDVAAPQLLPTPTPQAFALLAEALASRSSAAQQPVVLAGYVIAEQDAMVLAAGLTFDDAGAAHPHSAPAPIWLGSAIPSGLPFALRAAGHIQYAPALVRGSLEGPGAYGPGGRYAYQLVRLTFEAWPPIETNVANLLDQPQSYSGRLVRVVGGLLVRDGASLLVDRLGAGGIPAQQARQIKLRGAITEQSLLDQLKQTAGGAVRFGQVEVEGVLRGGLLVPLALNPVR